VRGLHEDVRECSVVTPHEVADAGAEAPPLDLDRDGADEAIVGECRLDAHRTLLPVVPPPGREPGVEHERTGSVHGPYELVPLGREHPELVGIGDRPERQHFSRARLASGVGRLFERGRHDGLRPIGV
jgi:hypothetical protein